MKASTSGESISVVIGAYNAASWIAETLDSIVAQTYPALEVLVVDDGSSDGTRQIVESYGATVKYMHENHSGYPHRNRGIMAAKGRFVAFIDSDDYWNPRKLELQTELLRSLRLAWVICEAEWLEADTGMRRDGPAIPDGDVLRPLLLGNFIASATPVVAKAVFERIGYFNERAEAPAGEDWDMWLRIAARFPVGCVHSKLATVRLHPGSFLDGMPIPTKLKSLENVIEDAVQREPKRLGLLKKRALANIYHDAGVQSVREAHFLAARQYFEREIRLRPLHMETLGYLLVLLLGASAIRRIVRFKRNLWAVFDRRVGRQKSGS